jgi:hypothetical protein
LGPPARQDGISGEQSADFGFIAELSSDLARSIAELCFPVHRPRRQHHDRQLSD